MTSALYVHVELILNNELIGQFHTQLAELRERVGVTMKRKLESAILQAI